ncbi:hypothetical protein HRbin30_02138 [bacterium HR30]|nr:hypothetical protein HRbin30_02138 [bacterium HR30]
MARYGGRVSPRRWGAVYLQRRILCSGGTDGLEGFGGRVCRLVQRQGEGRRSRRRRPMGGGVAAAVWLFGLVGFSPLLWPVAPVMAATFTVTSTADNLTNGDGFCTLREAISAANNAATNDCGSASAGNDTIVLQSGATYTLSLDGTAGNEDTGAEDDLDIAGASTAGTLTIQGNGATIERSTAVLCDPNGSVVAGEFRIVHVLSGGNLTLQNVTVENGCADGAGFPANSGGGIFVPSGGTLTVTTGTISNNSAGRFGGGIFNNNVGTVTLTNSTIKSNSAGIGVDVSGHGGTVTIMSSTITNNSAGDDGGGIVNVGTATIATSTISNNSVGDAGGGIGNGGTVTLTNSTISDNSADFGGGIFNNNVGAVTLTNSTISGNSSGGGSGENGGGIWNGGTVNASFVTIAANDGGGSGLGGGIFNDAGGTVDIKNSIVGDNTAGGGGPNCQNSGTITPSGNNLATDSSCGAGFSVVPSAVLNLGALANNGGATQTHALPSGSAAIDVVSDCTDLTNSSVTTDQRGVARPQGAQCDVGAYEAFEAGAAPVPMVSPWAQLGLLTLLGLQGIRALRRRGRELDAARD